MRQTSVERKAFCFRKCLSRIYLEFNNVYGDDTMVNPGLYYNYHAINMMMSLTGNVVDEGNFIYVDSWYKLVESSKGLGRHLTDIIGTVKED